MSSSAIKELNIRLTRDIPNIQKGWTVSTSANGNFSVTTPQGTVRIPPLDTITLDEAERALERLEAKGLSLRLAELDGAEPKRNGKVRPRVEKEEKRPPVYAGDPSPDEGPIRKKILLTPALANEFLSREWEAITSDGEHLRQRDLDRDGVEKFIGLLHGKKFLATYQGLGIGENGSLYDGQHRCHAIVETGIAAEVWVNYNMPADEVLALDGGRQRRASTKLSMRGFDHALELGSSARLLHNFLDEETAQGLGDTNGELVKEWRKWCNHTVSDLKVDDIVRKHPGLYEDLMWVMENKTERKHAPIRPAITVFRYIAQRAWPECEEQLDKFLAAVLHSVGITNLNHIALTLNKWVERTDAKGRPRYRREAHLLALIKAWNIYVNPPKKPVKTFPEHLWPKYELPTTGPQK